MRPSESPLPASTVLGHVQDGVIVVDASVILPEGQVVRIEPLSEAATDVDSLRVDRVRQLQQLFAQWTEEDAKLSAEDADCLHNALEKHRGVGFRSPALD